MKTPDINAIQDNVILRENLLVPRIETGVELNAFPRDGFVMEILTVLMEPMKTLLFTPVLLLKPVNLINSSVRTIDASTRIGFVIMTMTVEMVLMNPKTVPLEPVPRKSFLARTPSVSRRHIFAMEKMTVEMDQMNLLPNVRQK